jgi:hypothetical protein
VLKLLRNGNISDGGTDDLINLAVNEVFKGW